MRNSVFLNCLFLYAAFRLALWLKPSFLPDFLVHYLPDFLCLPLVLGVVVLVQRHIVLRRPGYTLNPWQVLFAVVYFSVLFELFFPHFYARYTADFRDVVAYTLGGLLYWIAINPEKPAQ